MNDVKPSSEDLAIVEQPNNYYVQSDQHNDAKRFSEFLAEDFIVQTPGVTRNRAEFLEYIAKPRPFKDLSVHDVKIRILSDVALIHGRSTYTVLADGSEQEALYTDTYQKRGGDLGLRVSLGDRAGHLIAAGQWQPPQLTASMR
ncbi:nuclear transport factor 2 family protein (plasmid) [Streptomyces sp. NBC_01450]|uniref:nuclear transport factor 2 family protein n=1 Tax=Streptomyces sp. NBC_01450 TaxID=2903871 RepID=UPI002E37F40E|nr:nuclear transport factor 2 family protein [Streptomyces sp. NBC_01450]